MPLLHVQQTGTVRMSFNPGCANPTSTNTYYSNLEDDSSYPRGKRWKNTEMKAIS